MSICWQYKSCDIQYLYVRQAHSFHVNILGCVKKMRADKKRTRQTHAKTSLPFWPGSPSRPGRPRHPSPPASPCKDRTLVWLHTDLLRLERTIYKPAVYLFIKTDHSKCDISHDICPSMWVLDNNWFHLSSRVLQSSAVLQLSLSSWDAINTFLTLYVSNQHPGNGYGELSGKTYSMVDGWDGATM